MRKRNDKSGLYWSNSDYVSNGNRLQSKLCHRQPNAEGFPFGGIVTVF